MSEVKQKSPLSMFFALGDKVTKNPEQKMNFDYYMMWIIFLAFLFVFTGNVWSFVYDRRISYLGWALFALAIMWFQYFNLRNIWTLRNSRKEVVVEKEDKIENVDEMIKSFK